MLNEEMWIYESLTLNNNTFEQIYTHLKHQN